VDGATDVELASVAGSMLPADVEEVDAVVVSDAVDVASVVVAVKAAARPVFKRPITRRLIRSKLTVGNIKEYAFI
jgi:hypothetical protein